MEKQEPIPSDAPPSYDNQGGAATSSYPPMAYPAQGYPAQGYAAQSYPAQNQYGMQQQNVVVTQPYPNTMMVNGPVPDYMGLALFATICCCWPLGIVAILRAQEARRAAERGDPMNGHQLAGSSKRLSIIAIACGVLFLIPAIGVLIWYFTAVYSVCYGSYC
ncbi:proline-rich transmembrane protein 1-like isoform X2 [Gigantopelta aegis]|uniref:proline-rich transmembrane protein 1-like isoform X2 n=1 Tax=Gigantopelta aegis TaxID=1735272 RepID=UPI001B88DA53|nr:proline-rich transmembrane protein 1-like isoform X2 [Gigantopelta aegis]